MSINAFIFDLDGVITDTAQQHYEAWKSIADENGWQFNKTVNSLLKGVSRMASLDIILQTNNLQNAFSDAEKASLAHTKNARYVALIETLTPDDILPGITAFLNELREGGYRIALASASKNAGTVLTRLGLKNAFDYVADAALIQAAKPDPEVFLNCVSALGLLPCECVGVEDAAAGVAAIANAGMRSIGINVEGCTVQPDIMLASTKELVLAKMIKALGE